MADPTDPITCDDVADDLELHVLDALEPADERRVAAHLEGCATCRARVDELTATLGELVAVVEPVEPPSGFAERVAARTVAPNPPPGRGPAPVAETSPGERGLDLASGAVTATRPRRVALIAAAAAVVVVLAAGLLAAGSWWASNQRDTDQVAGSTTVVVVDRQAPLVMADGRSIGTVSLTAGTQVDLTMTVDQAPAGVAYDCVVHTADGTVTTVGSWTTTVAGPATWLVALDPALGAVDEVSLVVPGTGTIATARPA
jgi:hypothetical protein